MDVMSSSTLETSLSVVSAAAIRQNVEYRNRPNPEIRSRIVSRSSGLSYANFNCRHLREKCVVVVHNCPPSLMQ